MIKINFLKMKGNPLLGGGQQHSSKVQRTTCCATLNFGMIHAANNIAHFM